MQPAIVNLFAERPLARNASSIRSTIKGPMSASSAKRKTKGLDVVRCQHGSNKLQPPFRVTSDPTDCEALDFSRCRGLQAVLVPDFRGTI